MSSRQTRAHAMQCPSCGSHYTQAVSLAYSQSIRIGYNGHQSISEFGRELEPPPAQSEFLEPLFVAGFVFVFSFAAMPDILSWVEIDWLSELGYSPWGRAVVCAAISIYLLFSMSTSAIANNLSEHGDEIRHWEREVICRRCGDRFSQ